VCSVAKNHFHYDEVANNTKRKRQREDELSFYQVGIEMLLH
jgi:hypothetical protein